MLSQQHLYKGFHPADYSIFTWEYTRWNRNGLAHVDSMLA